MPSYSIFGFTIESELPLPDLPEGTGAADAWVRYGSVKAVDWATKSRSPRFQAKVGELYLEVAGVARYLVRAGREILVDPVVGALEDEVRLVLVGLCMTALAQQRGLLTFHASSVVIGGEAVAFLGESGVGKSTLAMAFAKKGYDVFGDDVCTLSFAEDGLASVLPGVPVSKLCVDAVEGLDLGVERLRTLSEGHRKRGIDFCDRLAREPLPLARVYLLGVEEGLEVASVEAATGAERILALEAGTYGREYLGGLGLKEEHFRQIAALAKGVPIRKLVRPAVGTGLEELVARIVADCVSGVV